jgi:hypothetical protein
VVVLYEVTCLGVARMKKLHVFFLVFFRLSFFFVSNRLDIVICVDGIGLKSYISVMLLGEKLEEKCH